VQEWVGDIPGYPNSTETYIVLLEQRWVRISLDIQLILIKILCQRVGESMTITDILILLRQILYCTPKEGGGGKEGRGCLDIMDTAAGVVYRRAIPH
jgi:hypothetical protein